MLEGAVVPIEILQLWFPKMFAMKAKSQQRKILADANWIFFPASPQSFKFHPSITNSITFMWSDVIFFCHWNKRIPFYQILSPLVAFSVGNSSLVNENGEICWRHFATLLGWKQFLNCLQYALLGKTAVTCWKISIFYRTKNFEKM